MAIGHLTIAGLAEVVVTGGVVAYLQKADPSLLKLTAPNAVDTEEGIQAVAQRGGWRTVRPLLIGLAVLMVLSPLGLLAAGTAWGEWAPEDFNHPQARQEIQAGSLNATAPEQAPTGLQQLASVWTAPIPGYAPPFLQSEAFGYIMSAVFGTGLIILAFFLISWVARAIRGGREADPTSHPGTA
jgi:cobalt/nickel transport system permease protein